LAETAFSDRNTYPIVAVVKSGSNPYEQRSVAAVAVQKGENESDEMQFLDVET
jgi:hypothetical protein